MPMLGRTCLILRLIAATGATGLAAVSGGMLFAAINAPMPWVLGALVVVGIAAMCGATPVMPRPCRDVAITIIGLAAGGQIVGMPFEDAASGALVVMISAVFLGASIQVGYLYYRHVARFDRATSVLASIPGGLAYVAIMADSRNLPIRPLVIVHALRIAIVVSLLPLIFLVLLPDYVTMSAMAGPSAQNKGCASANATDIALMVVLAAVGWTAARIARLPAAPLLGPALASLAAYQFGLIEGNPPATIYAIAQSFVGAFIGAQFSGVSLRESWPAFVHGLGGGLLLLLAALIGGTIASHLLPHSQAEMVLALAPGGLPEMILLSAIVSADVGFIVALHTLRILFVLLVSPVLVALVSRKRD